MGEVFKAGDVVEIKSGGPKMTVSHTYTSNLNGKLQVACIWFDQQKKVSDNFSPESLKLHEPSK